ncbi:MAG TPA: arsenate reductase (thioredoxin) [Candidatus Salinicoccus stercoripullorum]|uniref:Arsenate reductase n=1 Tax=Candidatus Salinicoccus stercoripullorum TaxID=2838756 RepID=A0A9D1U0I7_9STAP|nr:arsenate reductase (thioredoxin) [Candidatus Salinicoccus stercoripullorum]
MSKPIVYFLCTGNSCRSQIAEGFGHKYLDGEYEVHSAGIEAHGMNPKAVSIMEEAGVDITDQESGIIDKELLDRSDYVITLCGDADDNCPMTPPHVKRMHWGFEDPAKATGPDQEVHEVFRHVRDAIEERVISFKENGR